MRPDTYHYHYRSSSKESPHVFFEKPRVDSDAAAISWRVLNIGGKHTSFKFVYEWGKEIWFGLFFVMVNRFFSYWGVNLKCLNDLNSYNVDWNWKNRVLHCWKFALRKITWSFHRAKYTQNESLSALIGRATLSKIRPTKI